MNFLFRETYWAGILILAGLLLILRNVFKLDLPVMGIIIPVIIISWGVSILMGTSGSSDKENTVFFNSRTTTSARENTQYNVVFGKGEYDLRSVKVGDGNRIDIDAVFSSARVLIDPAIPMRIKASSVFGSCRLPDGSVVSFGDRTYYTRAYRAGEPYADVKADVVFGEIRISEDASTFHTNSSDTTSSTDEDDD